MVLEFIANEPSDISALNVPQPTQRERFSCALEPDAHTKLSNLSLYLFLNKSSKHSYARCGPNFSLLPGSNKITHTSAQWPQDG